MIETGVTNGGIFFPSQPEFRLYTDFYQEVRPTQYSNEIALYYQFKTNEDTEQSLSAIPDGSTDLLFCCNSDNPSAMMWTSPLQRRKQSELRKNCVYFGIRLYPEQQIIKSKYPMKELMDQQIPLFEVTSLDPNLMEQIAVKNSFRERIAEFESCIRKMRLKETRDEKLIKCFLQEIYRSNGFVDLRRLSGQTGYTDRSIRLKFENYIGFSPKQFCQIVRFQNASNAILSTNKSDLLEISANHGYYDQAHFIRNFKKYANLTPTQFKEIFGFHMQMRG